MADRWHAFDVQNDYERVNSADDLDMISKQKASRDPRTATLIMAIQHVAGVTIKLGILPQASAENVRCSS